MIKGYTTKKNYLKIALYYFGERCPLFSFHIFMFLCVKINIPQRNTKESQRTQNQNTKRQLNINVILRFLFPNADSHLDLLAGTVYLSRPSLDVTFRHFLIYPERNHFCLGQQLNKTL